MRAAHDAAPGVPIDPDTFRTFSAALLRLDEITHDAVAARIVHDALASLRPLVPFRSAWWGECSDGERGASPRNWLHGRIRLSPGFAQEWNRLSGGDVFAQESMRRLGSVVRVTGYDDPDPAVVAFSRKHGLYHVMALTAELPGSGLMFFVSLYRGEHEPAFDEREALLFGEFTTHLLQRWCRRVQAMLLGPGARAADSFALADPTGELHYLGHRLGRVLHELVPDWSGSTLPPAVTRLLQRSAGAAALGRHRLRLEPCGGLVAIWLDAGRGDRLAPRERSVALLYARGQSYKEIARLLGLSPATVRSYLRDAYLQLGVRNKVQLAGALGDAPGRPAS